MNEDGIGVGGGEKWIKIYIPMGSYKRFDEASSNCINITE